MTEWISKKGMAMMRRKRRSETVIWNASLRAAGLMVLEISHRINSASTAASAMVVEKARADTRLIGGLDGRRPRLAKENHRA